MNRSNGEKTEKATPKKRRDARERGQVLKSTEVTTAFCSIVMLSLMLLILPSFIDKLLALYKKFLDASYINTLAPELGRGAPRGLYAEVLKNAALIMLPILGVAFAAALAVNIFQVGFLFTTKPLMPKLERISPIKGFARIFSIRTLLELLKSILKIVVLGYILYTEYRALLGKFPTLTGTELYVSFLEMMKTAFAVALKMAAALAVIAAFDFFVAWRKHEKDLMMTKQEVKDEYKLTEGDPQIKGRIRQKQRQMSMMRMMDRVPSADVVITNPTHYAVALKYDDDKSGAPVVVAKGQDYMARRIKESAREHGVEIVENRPLAQALYYYCELDDEIPKEFYQAVADILVYVYKRKQAYSKLARGNGASEPSVSNSQTL